MFAHKGCRIEHSFGWKRNYRHTKYGVLLRRKIQMKTQIYRELADVKEALPSGTSQQN